MFKKLFGKKKEPKTFEEVRDELLESIKEESLNKHVGKNFEAILPFFNEEAHRNDAEKLVEEIFSLSTSLPIPQCFAAISTCVEFFEHGYRNDNLVEKIVNYYHNLLNGAKPFFSMLDEMVKAGEEGASDEDVDVDSLYRELLRDRNRVSEKLGESVVKVEHFSRNMISILSIDLSLISKYKSQLKADVNNIKDYSQWCYWLDRLFGVLFNEPILVIDVDNHKGFEGRMNGIGDNYQLQYLLMSLPELNEHSGIDELALNIVNGKGPQTSNIVLEGKWNMYNLDIINQEDWTDIKIGPAKTMELSDFWIWGEGTPHEIGVHDGRRVVLLGRPTYARTTRVQRAFKNVQASIEVEKVLSEDEIDKWLGFSE